MVNEVSERTLLRRDALFGAGHTYAYLYPGLHKVVQAAGRVIRTFDDRGAVYLIDDRYAAEVVAAAGVAASRCRTRYLHMR